MKLHRILFLSLAFFLGCSDEDESPQPEPEPELVTVFSLSVDADYAFKKDNWIMVHDKNGILLDYQQVETGGVVKFETSEAVPDQKIGITIFSYDTAGSLDSY